MTVRQVCDWGPVYHAFANHLVRHQCPYCGAYSVIALCQECWDQVRRHQAIRCLHCRSPRIPVEILYTHMGKP